DQGQRAEPRAQTRPERTVRLAFGLQALAQASLRIKGDRNHKLPCRESGVKTRLFLTQTAAAVTSVQMRLHFRRLRFCQRVIHMRSNKILIHVTGHNLVPVFGTASAEVLWRFFSRTYPRSRA